MSGPAVEYLQYPRLLRNPRRPAADIRRLQEKALARLVAQAGVHVSFYRDMFRAAGLRPGDIRTVDALRALPLTSKSQLQDLPVPDRTADDVDLSRCRSFSTSGTTGLPLRTFYTPADTTLKNLAWARAHRFGGLRPRQKTAVLIGQKRESRRPSWYERLGVWRRQEISSWDPPADWMRRLSDWRPDVLLGYVMTLKILAETLRDSGVSLPLQAVFHSSALLDASSRRFLEDVFGCPVRDFYGSDEAGCIAWECPACSGYHIAADMVIVEIIKEGRPAEPGEEGEVVVTNLHSRAMPFIRYRQGDIAILSSRNPVCGLNFPLLERIQGRTDDFLTIPGRGKVTPHVVYHLLDPIPGLKRWRITQVDSLRLIVECEPSGGAAPDLQSRVETGLRLFFPPVVALDIRVVDVILILPGRKFRAVSSSIGGFGQ